MLRAVLSMLLPTVAACFHLRCLPPTMAAPVSFEAALEVAPDLCSALQSGEEPAGLTEFVSTSAGARGFFVFYLTGDEYACADNEVPPAPLAKSLEVAATDEVLVTYTLMPWKTCEHARLPARRPCAASRLDCCHTSI